MLQIPAVAVYIGVGAAALAVVAAVAAAIGQRRLFLAEREQRLRLRLAWENTTDLMGIIRVREDGAFINVDMNAANKAWFARALPQATEEDWKTLDLATLLRERVGYSEAEIDAALAPHREVVRTGRALRLTSDFRTTGERLHREAVLSPMKDAQGRVTHLFFRGTDVTLLRRAEQRFRDILEHTPALVAIVGRDDGRFRYVNKAWSGITGNTAEEANELTMLDLGVWSSDRSRRDALAPALERAEEMCFERSLKRVDGSTVQVLFSVQPIDHDGEPGLLAIGIDITELAQAREEAARMTAHFERVFRLMPEPLALATLDDGRLLEVNEAWLQMYGLSASRSLGHTVGALGLWAEPRAREELVARVKAGERVTGFAARFHTANGLAHCQIAAERISWKGQAVIVIATRDVTALERARRIALEESRHFNKLFSASPLPVAVTIGDEGRLVEVNPALEDFFGYTREEMVGRTALELGIFSDDAERRPLADAATRGEKVRGVPWRLRKRSGELAETLVSVEPMEWYGAQARLTVLQDVSALRRSAEEIRRLNESLEAKVKERTAELERAVQELESFSYSVSHDLRAPLRHIAGFTRMLLEDGYLAPGSEPARYADRAARAATRLGSLIDSLLDYSRLGRRTLDLRDTDLARTVAAIVEESGAGGRRVRWEIAPLPRVRADPTLIRLALQNLIDNAVKYTGKREEARIEIGARREEGEDVIWVRDNGVGFDMKYSGKLFGVFQRMHTDAEFEGTGIGLANAKRIVERHGGRIWFEAAPEHGATFYLALPAAAPEARAA